MNKQAHYKTLICYVLVIFSLLAGRSISMAIADADDAAKPEAHSEGIVATVTDAAITTKIKAMIAAEKSLSDSSISVTTTNGVVTLDGIASNSKAQSAAKKIAKSVDGVKSVDSNLKTPESSKAVAKTKEVVSDSWITTKVKSDILADSVAKGVDVSVNTTDGVVVLKGVLANQDAIDHVKDIAGKVNGVKGVDVSELTVMKK